MPDLIAEHVNSEGERISIERVTDGPHRGDRVLVLWDDPPAYGGTGTPAPMKLDAGTVVWLLEHLLDDPDPDDADYWLTVTVATVASERGMDPERVTADTRDPDAIDARRQVMVEADRLGYPATVIARYLGLHHTTVLHHLGRTSRSQHANGNGNDRSEP